VFYDQLKAACQARNTTPTTLLKEIGLSSANTGAWKKGGTPSAEVLLKLAERLNVSTDYLLDRTKDPTPPGESSEGEEYIDLGSIRFAFSGGNSEFSEADKQDLIDYARFIRQRKRKKEQEGQNKGDV